MKFIELLNHADPDIDYLATCINPKTGDFVEGKVHPLAAAIVLELRETFDPEAPDEDQLERAIATMLLAVDDIEDVIYSLEDVLKARRSLGYRAVSQALVRPAQSVVQTKPVLPLD